MIFHRIYKLNLLLFAIIDACFVIKQTINLIKDQMDLYDNKLRLEYGIVPESKVDDRLMKEGLQL